MNVKQSWRVFCTAREAVGNAYEREKSYWRVSRLFCKSNLIAEKFYSGAKLFFIKSQPFNGLVYGAGLRRK